MPLTDIACRRAAPKAKRYKLTDSLGLCLRISPNGSKYWVWRYRFDGRQVELALGTYPRISLVQARQARDKMREVLDAGGDPAGYRMLQEQSAAVARASTFEAVAMEWLGLFKKKRSARYVEIVESRLKADIFPLLGRRPIGELRTPDILIALRKVEKRGVHETTHRLKHYISMIFCHAIASGRAEHDMTAGLKGQLLSPNRGHYAAISSKQLPAFLRAMNDPGLQVGLQTRLAMRLLMYSFVRTSELLGARWDEFDLANAMWNVPAERMKMKRPHMVPLSRQALVTLATIKTIETSEYVFASRVRGKKTLSNGVFLAAIRRMGWANKMTGHGFRALATTILFEELKYPKHVVDLQLAHVEKDEIWGAYNRAQFIAERMQMMQAYADYLDWVETGINRPAAAAIPAPAPQSMLLPPPVARLRHLN